MKKQKGLIEVVDTDLRALLFWATIGVTSARGGFKDDEIEHILTSYAESLGYQLPYRPIFGLRLARKGRSKKTYKAGPKRIDKGRLDTSRKGSIILRSAK